jgi:hypothetical protein
MGTSSRLSKRGFTIEELLGNSSKATGNSEVKSKENLDGLTALSKMVMPNEWSNICIPHDASLDNEMATKLRRIAALGLDCFALDVNNQRAAGVSSSMAETGRSECDRPSPLMMSPFGQAQNCFEWQVPQHIPPQPSPLNSGRDYFNYHQPMPPVPWFYDHAAMQHGLCFPCKQFLMTHNPDKSDHLHKFTIKSIQSIKFYSGDKAKWTTRPQAQHNCGVK